MLRQLNLDSMCCVIQNGCEPCKRCLNCKQHSVTLKRKVIGRSQPFDVLMLQSKQSEEERKASTSQSESKLSFPSPSTFNYPSKRRFQFPRTSAIDVMYVSSRDSFHKSLTAVFSAPTGANPLSLLPSLPKPSTATVAVKTKSSAPSSSTTSSSKTSSKKGAQTSASPSNATSSTKRTTKKAKTTRKSKTKKGTKEKKKATPSRTTKSKASASSKSAAASSSAASAAAAASTPHALHKMYPKGTTGAAVGGTYSSASSSASNGHSYYNSSTPSPKHPSGSGAPNHVNYPHIYNKNMLPQSNRPLGYDQPYASVIARATSNVKRKAEQSPSISPSTHNGYGNGANMNHQMSSADYSRLQQMRAANN